MYWLNKHLQEVFLKSNDFVSNESIPLKFFKWHPTLLWDGEFKFSFRSVFEKPLETFAITTQL